MNEELRPARAAHRWCKLQGIWGESSSCCPLLQIMFCTPCLVALEHVGLVTARMLVSMWGVGMLGELEGPKLPVTRLKVTGFESLASKAELRALGWASVGLWGWMNWMWLGRKWRIQQKLWMPAAMWCQAVLPSGLLDRTALSPHFLPAGYGVKGGKLFLLEASSVQRPCLYRGKACESF